MADNLSSFGPLGGKVETTLDAAYEHAANLRKDMERKAEMIGYYSEGLMELVKRIESMPEFLTNAEHQLDQAMAKLLEVQWMLKQIPRKK